MPNSIYNNIEEYFFKDLQLTNFYEYPEFVHFNLKTTIHPKVCPHCGSNHIHQNNTLSTYLYDTAYNNLHSLLYLKYNQYECQNCKRTFTDEISLKHPHHQITSRLYDCVLSMLDCGLTIRQISQLTGLHWNTIKNIDKENLERKYMKNSHIKIPEELSEYIGVDEFLLHHPLKYATIVIDLRTGKVLWIGKGKSVETLHEFFKTAGKKWTKHIKAVAMDMNAPYAKCVEEYTDNKLCRVSFKFWKG